MIYFDVVNVPVKKDRDKGTAKDVSYWIEIYNYDDETFTRKKYRAKWVPETKESIDIIPDGYTKRVGLGYTDGNGSIMLLDSSVHYSEDGFGSQLDHLSNYGKFVFVAYISTGNDIYYNSPLFFLVENTRDKSPKITEMKNGGIWVKKANKANNDLWKNLIKDNKKKNWS